ncbi:MAG: hypothetical protein CVU16_13190 [Betaproteobacteria bacterium HGW-Betaproteobacteria-10]|jgi:hypothetical protein|nr:MAG: hypothetical protein CVU16_13190 [Betaproteobacteria bacterium HGW-Betaproteobacteria-10]
MNKLSGLKIKGVTAALLGTLAMVGAGPASAYTITDWDYILDNGFSAFAPAGATAVTGSLNNVALNLPTKLSWPSNDATQSSLGVGAELATPGRFAGTLTTNAGPLPTVQLIHSNNPIIGTSLSTATLLDQLQLSVAGENSYFTLAQLTFNINFLETPNQAPCAVPGGPVCKDIFVVDAIGAGFNPADLSFNQNFFFAPLSEWYNAKIFLEGIGVLSDAACDAVFGQGVNRGCIGLVTDEGQNNIFQAGLQISSVTFDVPEPGTVALLGLALLGLGATRRKAV